MGSERQKTIEEFTKDQLYLNLQPFTPSQAIATPADSYSDGLYKNLNANLRKDFNDVVLMFNQVE